MVTRITTIRYCLLVLALISFQVADAQQAWYVDANIGNDTYDGSSPTDDGGGVGPLATIQTALGVANDLDTIRVASGDYFGQLLIDKAIVMLGANENTPGAGARGAESTIYPDAIGLGAPADATNSLIQIASSEVVFKGFSLNGSNDALSSGTIVNGEDVDRAFAFLVLGNFDRVILQNNQVINFELGGIEALGNVNAPNSNCFFGDNLFDNFGDGSIVIKIGNGFYSDIFRNNIDNAETGIFAFDFTMSNGRPLLIGQNNIAVRTSGIQLSAINENSSNVYIDKNRVSTVFGFSGDEGISLKNCQGNQNLELRECFIANFESGILMFNNDFRSRLIQSDTVDNCRNGLVSITASQNSRNDTITIGSSIFNEIAETAIGVFADTTWTVLDVDNCLIRDSDKGIHAAGNVELSPGTTEFGTVGGYYIHLDTANSSIANNVTVDARECIFDGNRGKDNADADNFAIEDKIKHYMDFPTLAYVNFRDSAIYVSNNDGNDVIMRAVNQTLDDWHVHVQDVNGIEDVMVPNQIHITTYGDVRVGTLTIDVGGQQVFVHDTLATSGGLTLNAGRLNTQDGLVSVGEILVVPGNQTVVANGASYVDGPLQVVVQTTGTDTLLFPVGTAASYRPLEVYLQNSTTGNWDHVQAQLIEQNTPVLPVSNGISHVSERHYWNLSTTNSVMHDQVTYNGVYSVFGVDDQAGDAGNLRLADARNGEWYNIGGIGSANDNGSIQSTLMATSISDVVLANVKDGQNRLGKGDLIAAFDANSVCQGDTVFFRDNSTALVGTITEFDWDFGETAINSDTSDDQNPKYVYTNPGTYSARLIVISDLGARDTLNRTIVVSANPSVGFIEEIRCFPEACQFVDTSNVMAPDVIAFRSWDVDGATYSINPVLHNFPATGTYTAKLVVETLAGCRDSASKTFFQGDSVRISISPQGPLSICSGDSIDLTASSGIQQYQWNTNETTQTIKASQAQTYIVTGFNSNFCFGIDSVSVSLVPSPIANAGPDESIDYGTSTTLQGSGGNTYSWSPTTGLDDPTDPNTRANPLTTTTYILTASNPQGCTDTDTVTITVGLPQKIDVQNILTPNADGSNDVWDLSEVPDIENMKVTILNRWGKEVFSATNYQHDWGGTYEGEPLPDGPYIYILSGSAVYDDIKGPIQIIR